MAKKIILPVLALVFLIVAGVVFWYREIRLTPSNRWEAARTSFKKDFVITDTADGKLVENIRDKMSFVIPSDWTVDERDDILILYSPDKESGERNYLIAKGCKIAPNVTNIHINITTLKETLTEKFSWASICNDKYENIEIAGHKGILHRLDDSKLKMHFNTLHIPLKKLYEISLETSLDTKDIEKCEKIFEQVLNTLSIK